MAYRFYFNLDWGGCHLIGLVCYRYWDKRKGVLGFVLGPLFIVVATPALVLNRTVVDSRHFESVEGLAWASERHHVPFDEVTSVAGQSGPTVGRRPTRRPVVGRA